VFVVSLPSAVASAGFGLNPTVGDVGLVVPTVDFSGDAGSGS
jgi:hypothetical protein